MTAERHDAYGYPPRGMRREEAARYVRVSPTKFDEMVADGRMPPPKLADGCVIWDRFRLDEAFEALPDRDKPETRRNTFDVILGSKS